MSLVHGDAPHYDWIRSLHCEPTMAFAFAIGTGVESCFYFVGLLFLYSLSWLVGPVQCTSSTTSLPPAPQGWGEIRGQSAQR